MPDQMPNYFFSIAPLNCVSQQRTVNNAQYLTSLESGPVKKTIEVGMDGWILFEYEGKKRP